MKTLCLLGVVVALNTFPACMARTAHQAATPTGVLLDFRNRVNAYAALQQQQLTGEAVARPTSDGSKTDDAGRVMAERMRLARGSARQGDIFTPAVAVAIREALDSEVRGSAAANTRAAIRDDAPAAFRLSVNMDFPAGGLPTVPANVLAVLPTLPEGLDYRIVQTHLILRDTRANLVVDYLLDVMCEKC
jgi:hypothetical protein